MLLPGLPVNARLKIVRSGVIVARLSAHAGCSCVSGQHKKAVPITTALAPRISAAATPRPSPIPPAATTGMRTASTIAGTSAINPTSCCSALVASNAPRCPPASIPCATITSAPAASAFSTTVADAKKAEAAGADVIVAQGMEAGGHRGAFDATKAEQQLVGLIALVPAIVDAVRIPVVAAGGIGDGRGVTAALILGASAVVMGTAFLCCPETQLHPAWADSLATTTPERTILSRAFTGKPGRSIATDYACPAVGADAPAPAPYPVQRGLTTPMRLKAQKAGDVQRMQAWGRAIRRTCAG